MNALPFRIAAKIEIGDGCWEWTAARNAGGYGIVGIKTGCSGLVRPCGRRACLQCQRDRMARVRELRKAQRVGA